MTSLILQFLALAAVVVVAGTVLARAADAIAEATALSRLLVGSILLAAATSLPELAVNVAAVRAGMPDLAVGDLFGACLMNLMALAVLDVFHRTPGRGMLSRAGAAHAVPATLATILAATAAIGILTAPHLPRVDLFGLGAVTWVVLAAYLLGVRMVFIAQRISVRLSRNAAEVQTAPDRSWVRPAGLFLLAAVTILAAGPPLARVAGELADRSGLGDTFVGTTLLAVCTTLPELATSIAAVRMGAFDLAIGNVFGSNAFNMLLLVPLDAVHPGPLLADVTPLHAVTALGAIVASSVAVLGQLYPVERRNSRIEPDALLVLAVVLGILYAVFRLAPVMGTAH